MFFCSETNIHFYSTRIFGSIPVDQIDHVGDCPSEDLKLIRSEIIFEVFQPMWSQYLNVTDGMDGQTDDWRLSVALRIASLDKNLKSENVIKLHYNHHCRSTVYYWYYLTFFLIIGRESFERYTATDTRRGEFGLWSI